MYGTARNPYPEDLIKTFNIKQTHPNKNRRPLNKNNDDTDVLFTNGSGNVGPQDNSIDSESSNNTNKVLGKFFLYFRFLYLLLSLFFHSSPFFLSHSLHLFL